MPVSSESPAPFGPRKRGQSAAFADVPVPAKHAANNIPRRAHFEGLPEKTIEDPQMSRVPTDAQIIVCLYGLKAAKESELCGLIPISYGGNCRCKRSKRATDSHRSWWACPCNLCESVFICG